MPTRNDPLGISRIARGLNVYRALVLCATLGYYPFSEHRFNTKPEIAELTKAVSELRELTSRLATDREVKTARDLAAEKVDTDHESRLRVIEREVAKHFQGSVVK